MDARPCRLRLGAGLWALVLLAACGRGSSAEPASTEPGTSAAPTTSRSVATTAPPTSSSAVTTTSEPAGDDARFEPACVERDRSAPVPDDSPGLDTLGLLGAEPVVQLHLPRIPIVEGTFASSDIVRAAAFRIPGGMLVTMRPYEGTAQLGQLVAIDATGEVRWSRCLDEMPTLIRIASDGHASEVLLGWSTYHEDGTFSTRMETWSLADGVRARTWAEVLEAGDVPADAGVADSARAEGPNVIVLGVDQAATTPAPTPLLVLDLRTMTARRLPDPRSEVPGLPAALQLDVTPDDVVVAYSQIVGAPYLVGAVWTGERWTADPALIEASVPTRVQFVYEADRETLFGIDAAGRTVWHREDLFVVPGEGFRVAVDGGVAIALTCAAPLEPDGEWCPGAALVGVDAATGRTLWQQDGRWTVAFVADGVAMVASLLSGDGVNPPPPAVWRMIALHDGRTIGRQTWVEPNDFSVGCCDEPARLDRFGGVVVTWNADTVELWYPAAASTSLRTVSLG